MVPLARIGLATPSLPMTCSTTELQRHNNIKSGQGLLCAASLANDVPSASKLNAVVVTSLFR